MRATSIYDKVKIVMAVVPSAGSVGALVATEVNGNGYGRATFVFTTGACGTGATLTPKIQNSATSGGSFADISGATLTQIIAATGANKQFVIDLPVNSARPYMQVVGTIGVQTIANSCIALLYNGITFPDPTAYALQVVKV